MAETLSGELKAMAQVEAALKGLPEEEMARVIQWAVSKFRAVGKGSGTGGASTGKKAEVLGGEDGGKEHPDLATFYGAAGPSSDQDKALVGAYWLQVKEGAEDVDAQTVNTRLKHLGHGIGNITRAFETLKAQKPAMIVQTRKEGKTQQARKKFRVTTEGKKKVEGMVKQASGAA